MGTASFASQPRAFMTWRAFAGAAFVLHVVVWPLSSAGSITIAPPASVLPGNTGKQDRRLYLPRIDRDAYRALSCS